MYWGEGFVIPFTLPNGEAYQRVKLDFPRHDDTGKPVKYESPLRKSNHAYFPPGFWELLRTASMIIIVEGEKKALAIQQFLGIPCIGMVGVWGWQDARLKSDAGRTFGERRLIQDLRSVGWKEKRVLVCFDSDVVDKSGVRLAEARLAEVLTNEGATVRVMRLPSESDGKKNGADDYLVRHGADEFRRLMDEAKDAELPPSPSAMDWARMFVAEQHTIKQGITLRWWRDQTHAYDGFHYRPIPDSDLQCTILQWLDSRGANATTRLANEVMRCMASEVRVAFDIDQPVWLADEGLTHPNYIAMQNGLFDVDAYQAGRELILHRKSPRWFSSMCLPYQWDPNAKCDVWLETLTAIFDGDEESIDCLAEWFGYCLIDWTSLHKILMLQGPPRSGKGTIFRAMQYAIGEENTVACRLSQLGETFGLWPLVGKRLAVVPDAHLGQRDGMATLEALKSISGEDAQPIHRKHMPSITARLGVRFALAVNELPRFADAANALLPRLVILSCPNSFIGREDRSLEEKLRAEAPGIFLFALDGLMRLRKQGRFTQPAKSREIETEFERLSSPVKSFITDFLIVKPGLEVDRDLVWTAWKSWCNDNGHEKPGTKELLGSRLRVHIRGLDSVQRREGAERWRTYVGVEIKPEVLAEIQVNRSRVKDE